jgi:hypothetical protein
MSRLHRSTHLALFLSLAVAASAASAAAPARTFVFDAVVAHAGEAGPGPDSVGHVQLASGDLRDVRGGSVGSFAYRCRWTSRLAGGDFAERCSGRGTTVDGRVDFAGGTHRRTLSHTFSITGGTGRYAAARGSVEVRDVTEAESVITLTFTRVGVSPPRVAAVTRPPANTGFRARASSLCGRAAERLAALPQFPFDGFDPEHPDPKLLPKVGAFFTGPGDPRPLLRRLEANLRALKQPPADGAGWRRVLAAEDAARTARAEQHRAALAGDAARFVRSLRRVDAASRAAALSTAAFGVPRCAL